ncbi:MAG: sigma-70 family RNA polymerase sigma factor [Verrucomicrobiae bacterium]|nr:sigma-70 family RNA polymerase sigma factor [Verrucomicrobiae bacterium]
MNPLGITPGAGGTFATTRWTQVLRARGKSDEARVALGELCQAYWEPVFQFIRRTGQSEDAARDLTQEFFARLLARQGLDTVQPGWGRFRSFLLGAVKHFLSDMRDRAQAARRGGGWTRVPMGDGTLDPATPASPDRGAGGVVEPPPDAMFDRAWATSLVNRAVEGLAIEMARGGRAEVFAVLKPWLLGEVDDRTQGEAATRLGWTENAVRVAVHRLRRRFRERVQSEIADTIEDPGRVREEMRYLLEALLEPGSQV